MEGFEMIGAPMEERDVNFIRNTADRVNAAKNLVERSLPVDHDQDFWRDLVFKNNEVSVEDTITKLET